MDVLAPQWSDFIQSQGWLLLLVRDPGVDHLSRYELGKLDDVRERFRNVDDYALARQTHQLAEWRDPHGSSLPISLREILDAIGRGRDAERIEADARAESELARALGTHG